MKLNKKKPLVIVTRKLPDLIETRMRELFDAHLNLDDAPLSKAALIEAAKTADFLVPTLTDKIDSDVISAAGPNLKLIANFGNGVDHIDIAAAQAKGIQVLLTRTSEVDVDLPPRVALANNSRADLFLSIHANALSMSRPDVNGIETFYFQDSPSRRLAEAVQQQMVRVSPGSPDRGTRPGRFFVIRRTVMPAALAEMGFVTGQLDSPRLADPAFRRRMAVAIATGLLNYLVANP